VGWRISDWSQSACREDGELTTVALDEFSRLKKIAAEATSNDA